MVPNKDVPIICLAIGHSFREYAHALVDDCLPLPMVLTLIHMQRAEAEAADGRLEPLSDSE